MAKAHLVMADGTKVEIEGRTDEVANLLAKCTSGSGPAHSRASSVNHGTMPKVARQKNRRQGPVGYITELVSDGYFKSKRRLPDVQAKLEEKGRIYAQTSLSPALLHHVRKLKTLRRIKEKDGWVYVC